MTFLKQLWLTLRSNPYFVAVYSAAAGAVVSALQDEYIAGHIDFSRAGISKLISFAVTAGIAALVHLYRPAPLPK